MKTTDNERAQAVIGAIEGVRAVIRERDSLIVEFPRDRAMEISRALAEQQIYLWELKPRESTLEEFFLEVTGDHAAGG